MLTVLTIVLAAIPILKDGLAPCPPNYAPSGNYCVPQRDAGIAVPKVGPCPPGYASSGHYCVGRPQR